MLNDELLKWLKQNEKLVLDEFLRTDFSKFIQRSFQSLNPGTPFEPNWHISAIAWHLEQVRLGKIKRLIIAMPPRSVKSISASIAFPAFVHGHDPTVEFIAVSYGQSLSDKLHNDYRQIMSSTWYKGLFPQTKIDPKKDNEQEVRLTGRGGRFATSVGGVLTGRGADIIIIDDPLKPDDANSEAGRSKMNDWYGQTLMSRLNQKKDGAIVIVSQRVHTDDLIGHATQYNDSWTVLELPVVAEEDQVIQTGNKRWHRRRKGQLLHPEREDQLTLDQLKLDIGSPAFAAQYQQRPVPPGGNMFKKKWINYYDKLPEQTNSGTIIQSWDTASKTGPENDWSVCTTWLHQDGLYFLLDIAREKLDYPALRKRAVAEALAYTPWVVLVEDTGVGTGLIAELVAHSINVVGVTPSASKAVRASRQSATFESQRVLFPRSAPWLSELEAELLAFPNGKHDDQVDSITQALAYNVPTDGGVSWV